MAAEAGERYKGQSSWRPCSVSEGILSVAGRLSRLLDTYQFGDSQNYSKKKHCYLIGSSISRSLHEQLSVRLWQFNVKLFCQGCL